MRNLIQKIHHVSSVKNASFGLHLVMPHSTGTKESHCRLVCRCLSFSPSEEDDDDTPTDEIPSQNSTLTSTVSHRYLPVTTLQVHPACICYPRIRRREVEEDFQTVPLDDEHWDMEEIPDRPLCIHKHSLLHGLCPYPCPYLNYTGIIIL